MDEGDKAVYTLWVGGLVENLTPEQIASLFKKVCLDYEYEAIQEAFKD
jgi:hypothetical protein